MLQIKSVIEDFLKVIYTLFLGMVNRVKKVTHNNLISYLIWQVTPIVHVLDLDFTFLEMNPFTLVDGKPYPLDMRGELDDTAAFKNFKK